MKNGDVEYARINASAENFREVLNLVRHAIACATYLAAIWLIFEGLCKVIGNQTPDGITAFAKVIQALGMGSILGYVFGAGAIIAWKQERTGKKRAIREKNRYQKIVERSDPNRTSSGLDEFGDTPDKE